MKTTKLLPIVYTISLFLVGCERPEKTVDQLRKEISEFRTSPDDQKSAAVEASLAKLDTQILKLRAHGSIEKATLLQEQRDSFASDFGTAKISRTLQDAKSALKGIQDVIKKTDENLKEESPQPSPSPDMVPKADDTPAEQPQESHEQESTIPSTPTPEANATP